MQGSIRVLEKVGMRYWKTDVTDVCGHAPQALFYRIDRADRNAQFVHTA